MNQSSDDRNRLPVFRIAGVGLGVLGAMGGVAGCILGRSLYEGAIDPAQALTLAAC